MATDVAGSDRRGPGAPLRRAVFIAALVFIECLLAYFVLAQRSPVSGDDFAFLYQAQLFASGRVTAVDQLFDPAHPQHACAATKCLTDHDGHRFSKYPPGWSALLAAGVALRAPWVINPLLAAALVLLMLGYAERRLGRDAARDAGTLLALCAFFAYYGGSFRAHTATALLVFGAFLLWERAEREARGRAVLLAAAGALLGASALVRYLDWVPLFVWIAAVLARRRRARDLFFFAAGFAAIAAVNLLYGWLIAGNPAATPTGLYDSGGLHDRLHLSWQGFAVTGARLATLAGVFPPVLLLAVYARRVGRSAAARRNLALFGLSLGVYFFYPASVGGPGPRYLLTYFPFLVLTVAELLAQLHAEGSPRPRLLRHLALAALVLGSVSFAAIEARVLHGRRDLERTLARHGVDRGIVLLKSGTYKTNRGDLLRNPPDLDTAQLLYFAWCDDAGRAELLERFAGRPVWVYEYPEKLASYRPPARP